LNDISSSEDEHIDGGNMSSGSPAKLPGSGSVHPGWIAGAGAGVGVPGPVTGETGDDPKAAVSGRPKEDRMAAESPGRPEEDRMVAESPGRPEEDRMVAESPGRPEEDRMAAESPGRPPSRGEEDQETLRMIADLGEAPGIKQLVEQSPRGEEDQETLRMIADLGEVPGIEQLVEQSPMPKKISIR
jgi:hypothetical protein